MTDLSPQRCPPEYAKADLSPVIAEIEKTEWSSILLIGPAGTGKTTQLWALQRRCVSGEEFPGKHWVHVISECGDIDRYRYEWDFLEAWAKFRGVLCVDDIGYRKPTDWTIQAVYYLATKRRAFQRQTIWTSNLDRDRLAEAYGSPIASRLTGGHVIDTGGPDRRQGAQP